MATTVEIISEPITVNTETSPVQITVGSTAFNTVAWGNITGTLSNQTDLWSALSARVIYVQTPPANENDFSGLPGGIAPSSGAYVSFEANQGWVIWGGQTNWWRFDLSLP